MSQIGSSTPGGIRLGEALRGSKVPLPEIFECLHLPQDSGWLADALAGRIEPETAQLALLSACSGVPLTVLAGAVPPERTLAVALRASLRGVAEAEPATERAERGLADL